jgi:biotin synthase-related radical SAM superfamily protein
LRIIWTQSVQTSTCLYSWKLKGLKSKKDYQKGMIVFVGKDITAKDVFAKMVDNGHVFSSVDSQLECLEKLISDIPNFKIGTKVTLSEGKLNVFQS